MADHHTPTKNTGGISRSALPAKRKLEASQLPSRPPQTTLKDPLINSSNRPQKDNLVQRSGTNGTDKILREAANPNFEASKLPSRPPHILKDPLINSSNRPQKDNLVPRSGTNETDEIKREAANPQLEASKLPSRPPQTLKDSLINSSNRPQKDNLVPRSGTNETDEIKREAANPKLEASKLPSPPPQSLKDSLINSSTRPQKDNLVPRSGTNGTDEIMREAVNPESGIRGHIAGDLYGSSIHDKVDDRLNLSNVLFVEGLPTDCTRREVSHLFRPFPGLQDIKVVHKLAKTRGEKDMVLCFVKFANGRCALTALKALQGYIFDIKKPVSPALNIHMAHFPFRLPSDGDTQNLAVPR